MSTRDTHIHARGLIEMIGWTQDVSARDIKGDRVQTCSPTAASFCAVGALGAARGGLGDGWGLLDDACGGDIIQFNDAPGRTREEVLAVFDRAIELAEAA